MVTTIISNGSKWAGDPPDPIATLLDVLARETLDPRFEKYGNFETEPGRFFGNFLTVSHVFNISTTDKALARRLRSAIRRNQATEAYQHVREEQAR